MNLKIALFMVCFASATVLSAEESSRPNFLWIVAEDISPLFGCYGAADAITPHIDKLAEQSHVFLRAYATAPICAPSRSCLATGMYATSLGTQNLRSEVRLPSRIRPLARHFREHGYWTTLRGKTDYNFDPNGLFDYWKQTTTPWRSCPKESPFFAFMNLGSTHEGSGNFTTRAATALKRLPPQVKHDPGSISLPPYSPDTPEMRRIWARYYDLITVFDLDVHAVLEQLKQDGHADDTIVFLMADHGMGLPRYKRWLYLTGLQVPLIIHIPEAFQQRIGNRRPGKHTDLVSYVDLPPTILHLAGIPIPENFQGYPLFTDYRREVIFGARDRADDMYDLSRAVFDGRYLYIRHYLPHMIPMQEGYIMGPTRKESHKELYRVQREGGGTMVFHKLWQPRPYEELYDILNDPQELLNLADRAELQSRKTVLVERLRQWIVETRDSAFMTEPEMHRRANQRQLTPYDILQDQSQYDINAVLEAAEQASKTDSPWIKAGQDPVLLYWAIQQRIIRADKSSSTITFLQRQLKHVNPMVRATAAEALARLGQEEQALPVFRSLLNEQEPNLLLYIARSLAISMSDVRPIEQEIRQTRQRLLAPPGSPRPWKDFNYAAFTSWALEWALIKSNLNSPEDFGWHR